MVLRVNLYRDGGGAPLASPEKPFDLAADLQTEVDDICDALGTIGIHAVSVAMRFGKDGQPEDVQPYSPAVTWPVQDMREFDRKIQATEMTTIPVRLTHDQVKNQADTRLACSARSNSMPRPKSQAVSTDQRRR